MTHLSLSPDTVKDHILVDGIIRSGMAATFQRVKQLFAWLSLKQSVQEFVQQC
jgi:hypothetical protein